MSWHKPTYDQIDKAIQIYLSLAYTRPVPAAVRTRLDQVRAAGNAQWLECSAFERPQDPDPPRYSLRLGNGFYPHMKLVIERAPDGEGFLLRADTHDRHCCPDPASREYPLFCQLMEQNQQLSQAIEAAWEREHLPTFKSFLRRDLARRQAAAHAKE